MSALLDNKRETAFARMLPVAASKVLALLQQIVAQGVQRVAFREIRCRFRVYLAMVMQDNAADLLQSGELGINCGWHLEDRQKCLLNDLLAASVQPSNA